MGGKKALARRIIDRIACIPHATYAEPFSGMGGVFLRRPFRAQCEVLNDINGEIVNLFRIVQRHYPQLLDVMRFQITSRSEFERLRQTDPATLTDLERAARFMYLQRLVFGGKLGCVFGVQRNRGGRFDLTRLKPLLEAAHERLAAVVLESLDWSELVDRYDTAETLFYLDPPYAGGEDDYGKGLFSPADFERMAEQLAAIEGAFILSINDTAEIRTLFDRFTIEPVSLTYTVSRGDAKQAAELLISNGSIEAGLFG